MRNIEGQGINSGQRGVALLVLVIALALAISAFYFSSISITKIESENLQDTRVALTKAKQLLLGYAAVRAEMSSSVSLSDQPGRYGYLPCPANNNGEGNSTGTCDLKNENALGWFPWRSLSSEPIMDSGGDCLLYAVSGSYKASPSADMLNEDTNGMFQIVDDMDSMIHGATAQERIVAVVFSAGNVLPGQIRNYENNSGCGYQIDNFGGYLDSYEVSAGKTVDNSKVQTGAADEIYQLVQTVFTTNKDIINDRLITISREELWAAIISRADFNQKMSNLTEALALCLNKYASDNSKKRLPWPAPMNVSDYRIDDKYDDVKDALLGYAGRFPYVVDDSNDEIGISAAEDNLFVEAACDNIVLPTSGETVHLVATSGLNEEYKNLWTNWKDHFFYVVSRGYAAKDSSANCSGMSKCITVNSATRAAAVIFSGSRLPGAQVRTGPVAGDSNTKHLITNYLENGNETIFPDASGRGNYVTGGNDIMFCIRVGLGVEPC